MNEHRYRAYREILATVDALALRDGERALLKDAAEGFLLAADVGSSEIAELGLGVAIILDRAVDAQRVKPADGDRLTEAFATCGPAGVELLAA